MKKPVTLAQYFSFFSIQKQEFELIIFFCKTETDKNHGVLSDIFHREKEQDFHDFGAKV